MKILLLDAGNQNTLAITRWLGKSKSGELHLAGFNKLALSFYSKYCKKKYILPRPSNQQEYFPALLKLVKEGKFDILFPVGNYSFETCVRHYDELSHYCKLLVPGIHCFDVAASKAATYKLAEECGVHVPAGYTFETREQLFNTALNFPVVIKAPFEMGKNVVEYAGNKKEFFEKFDKMCAVNGFGLGSWPIIQQYIRGDGYGFFAFYDNGKCGATFMHKRIREYPVTGGASTCAISVNEKELADTGKRLLDKLGWNGAAMVEFKRSNDDGKYYLMEINPKFWGSLELALASGVNFPEMVINKLTGQKVSTPSHWKDVRFQWVLNGELFHFFERPSSFLSIIRDLFRSKKDFRWSDPLPNLIQVVMIFNYFFRKLTGKK
ncbi:MAG: ATP-grasp domain-containing protein [Bacteroidia bacterium]